MRRALESQATPDERHVHGAGDYSPVVIRPRRSAASGYLSPDRACASREVADLPKVKAGMKRLRGAKLMQVSSAAGTDLKISLEGAVAVGGWGYTASSV